MCVSTHMNKLCLLCILFAFTADCCLATLQSEHWRLDPCNGGVYRSRGLLREPTPGLVRVSRLRGGGGDAEDAFKALMALSGSSSTLRLRDGQRGRGLFTDRAVEEGEELLRVPLVLK